MRSEALAVVPFQMRLGSPSTWRLRAARACTSSCKAIESLRPREAKPRYPTPGERREDYPLGIRFFADVVAAGVAAYRAAWRGIPPGPAQRRGRDAGPRAREDQQGQSTGLAEALHGLRAMTLLTRACSRRWRSRPWQTRGRKWRGRAEGRAEARSAGAPAPRSARSHPLRDSGRASRRSRVPPPRATVRGGDEGSLGGLADGSPLWSEAGLSNLGTSPFTRPAAASLLSEKRRSCNCSPGHEEAAPWVQAGQARVCSARSRAPTQRSSRGLAFREEAACPAVACLPEPTNATPAHGVAVACDPEPAREDDRPPGRRVAASDRGLQGTSKASLGPRRSSACW